MAIDPALASTLTSLAAVMDQAKSDPAYRQQLEADPAGTLQNAGVAVPAGVKVYVAQNSAEVANLVTLAKASGVSAETIQQAIAAQGDAGSPVPNLEAYARLVLQTWTDGDLKARLLADPGAVLAEHGIAVPEKVKVKVLEAGEELAYVVLPAVGASTGSASTPSPTGGDGSSLGTVASSVYSSFGYVADLITASSYLAGAAFAAASVMQLKAEHDSPTPAPVGSPMAFMLLAAAATIGA
jgi:hypothetical protein